MTESRTDENVAEAAFKATKKKHSEDRCSRKDAWTLASRIIFSMAITVHAGFSDIRVKKQKRGNNSNMWLSEQDMSEPNM